MATRPHENRVASFNPFARPQMPLVAAGPGRHDHPAVSDIQRGEQLHASLYDAGDVGWPGELELYRRLARDAGGDAARVLDVGCGTGRIALALASDGCLVTGADASAAMIDVARAKTRGPNPHWIVSDMRRLDVDRTFQCVIVGGHSFQFMTTPEDAVEALRAMRERLTAGGRVILHIDNPARDWLEDLPDLPGEPRPSGAPRIHPVTRQRWQLATHWSLDRGRHDAVETWRWERLGRDDQVLERVALAPLRLHVFEPDEVERGVTAAGLRTEATYGDFDRSPLTTDSPSMIWLARRR